MHNYSESTLGGPASQNRVPQVGENLVGMVELLSLAPSTEHHDAGAWPGTPPRGGPGSL